MAEIIPAILTDNVNELNKWLSLFSQLTDRIQIDLIDGFFIDNKTIDVDDIPHIPKVHLELHLMTYEPQKIFTQISHPSIKTIIFHYEAVKNPAKTLSQIPHQYDKGIAINPKTPIENIKPLLADLDLVTLMSIEPGKQGQSFIPESILKIATLHAQKKNLIIEVDGGINLHNATLVKMAGASRIVVGATLIKSADPITTFRLLQGAIKD